MLQMFQDEQGGNQTVNVRIVAFGGIAEAARERIMRGNVRNAGARSETPRHNHADLVIVAVGTDDEREIEAACDFIRTAKAENALAFSVVYTRNGAAGRIGREADAVLAASSEENFAETLGALFRYMSLFLESKCEVGVDFADLKELFSDAGEAHFGVGLGEGGEGVSVAMKDAITKPITGSFPAGLRSVFIGIAADESLEIFELQKALAVINDFTDEGVAIIWCFAVVADAKVVRVMVIAA